MEKLGQYTSRDIYMRDYGQNTRFDDTPDVEKLTQTLNKRTGHFSSPEYIYHDEFWRVVDMGEEALPALFLALDDEETSSHLHFHAITCILHDLRLPMVEIPEEMGGSYDLVRQAFVGYGQEQGFLGEEISSIGS